MDIVLADTRLNTVPQEKRLARKKLHEAVAHWEAFFAKNGKYHRVGTVRYDEGWLERLPRQELCAAAKRQRPRRGGSKAKGR